MNTREFNKMNMFTAVNSVFQLSNDSIAKIRKLAEARGRFNDKLVVITGHEAQYTTAAAGATASKNSAAAALIDVVLRVANALSVLGNNTGNEQMKAECRLRQYGLNRKRALELIKISSRVAEIAQQHVSELDAYGIVDSDIGSLAAAIVSFSKAREEQQQRLAEIKSGRRMLYKDMVVADSILKNEIDPLMELINGSDPGFYNQYWAAQVIKDLRARASKEEQTEATLESSPPKTEPVVELAKAA